MAQITQIIPTYNMKDTICRTIDSCLNQTVKAPILVVDDGSTDDTFNMLLDEYGGEIALVRIKNKGLAGAMNYALKLVKTPYFVFTGADDVVDKENIENWKKAYLTDVNYCRIGAFKPIEPEKILPNIKRKLKDLDSIEHCHQFYTDDGRHIVDGINCLCLNTEMVRKNPFDENLRHKEGGELVIRLALLGYEFRYFDFIGGYKDRTCKSADVPANKLAIEYIKKKISAFNIS